MGVAIVGVLTMPSNRPSWFHARIVGCQHYPTAFAPAVAFTAADR